MGRTPQTARRSKGSLDPTKTHQQILQIQRESERKRAIKRELAKLARLDEAARTNSENETIINRQSSTAAAPTAQPLSSSSSKMSCHETHHTDQSIRILDKIKRENEEDELEMQNNPVHISMDECPNSAPTSMEQCLNSASLSTSQSCSKLTATSIQPYPAPMSNDQFEPHDEDDDDTIIESSNEDLFNENSSSEDEEVSRPVRKKPKTDLTNQTPCHIEQQQQQQKSRPTKTTRKLPRYAQKHHKTNVNKLRTNSGETVNQSDKYILLSLKCDQLECAQVFVQPNAINKLNAHTKSVHKIEKYPCLVRDCGQSFNKKSGVDSLTSHMKTTHKGHTTKWSCGKCDRHFSTHFKLYSHNFQRHYRSGEFKCVHPKCKFTSKHHVRMTRHHGHCKHRPEQWRCHRPGCAFGTNSKYQLGLHESDHLGVKLYRCTWPHCEHENATERKTLMHIKAKHFRFKPSTNGLDKAKDYLKMVKTGKKRIDSTKADGAKKCKQTTDDANESQENSKTTNEVVSQVTNRQFITLSLRCHQLECKEVFVKPDALNKLIDHLWEKHLISPFRCLLKDCGKSFENTVLLGRHLRQAHRKRDKSQWHCGKCDKHYTSHSSLSAHHSQIHHLGVYQCAHPTCALTFDNKAKLYDHFEAEHKAQLGCKWRGCKFKHKNPTELAAHERSHRGAKPYQCKLPGCAYAHASLCRTMTHIWHHLKKYNQSARPDGGTKTKQRKPKDYLRVVRSLL